MRHRQCMFGSLNVWFTEYRARTAAVALLVNNRRDVIIFTAYIPCLHVVITLLMSHETLSRLHCWHIYSLWWQSWDFVIIEYANYKSVESDTAIFYSIDRRIPDKNCITKHIPNKTPTFHHDDKLIGVVSQ